jgi:2-dehydro-3-deoxyphosphooctonate aldolase (KDO 8-P synthase)
VHEDPENAPSDGPNMLKLSELKQMLLKLVQIDKIIKS